MPNPSQLRRIIPPRMPRMTPHNPPHSPPCPLDRPKLLHRPDEVITACRLKSALPPHNRTQGPLINAHQQNQYPRRQIHNRLNQKPHHKFLMGCRPNFATPRPCKAPPSPAAVDLTHCLLPSMRLPVKIETISIANQFLTYSCYSRTGDRRASVRSAALPVAIHSTLGWSRARIV